MRLPWRVPEVASNKLEQFAVDVIAYGRHFDDQFGTVEHGHGVRLQGFTVFEGALFWVHACGKPATSSRDLWIGLIGEHRLWLEAVRGGDVASLLRFGQQGAERLDRNSGGS